MESEWKMYLIGKRTSKLEYRCPEEKRFRAKRRVAKNLNQLITD
jgi:hypothetical protein